MARGLVGGFLEGKARLKGSIVGLARLHPGALARRAARIQVEEFGGDVANALRGLAARLLPLLAAELVQGRRLGRRSRVARDEVQSLHGHVQLVAVGVLEHQKLAGVAGDIHGLQPDVASHAVGFVNHRGADAQIRQFLEYLGGIPLRAPPPALLAGAVAEQLRLGENFERRRFQPQARDCGRHGDSQPQGARHEARESVEYLGLHAAGAQQIEQQLAAAGGLGGEQDSRRARLDVRRQLGGGLLRPRIDTDGRRCGAREIPHLPRRLRRPLEGVQLNLRPRGIGLEEFRGSQIHFGGIQYRPAAVVAQLFMAFDDAVPQAVHRGSRVVHVDEHAVGRKILEQMGSAVEEQGQKVFDASRRHSLAHVPIDRLLGQVARESQAVAAAKLAHGVGIERCLARREQLYALELVERALGVGIETADAVDIAIQHVDAVRRIRAHGEHVDQRTADGEFAVGDDLGHGGVAGHGQLGAQRVQIEGLPDVDLERVGLHITARRQPLQERVDGHQPDSLPGAGQLGQCGKPGGGDVGMGGKAVVGQRLQVGKHPHGEAGAAEESNFIAEGLRVAGTLRDDHEGSLSLGGGFGDGEGCGGAVELAPLDEAQIGSGQERFEERHRHLRQANKKRPAANESRRAYPKT